MTDTNYNDGNWHIKPSDFCPVHPESIVQTLAFDPCQRTAHSQEVAANLVNWASIMVIAFRVTKEHKEPREFWLCRYGDRKADVLYAPPMEDDVYHSVIHVREVIGENT